MNTWFWKMFAISFGLLFCGDISAMPKKRKKKAANPTPVMVQQPSFVAAVSQTNASNASSSAATVPAPAVVRPHVAPPRPSRPDQQLFFRGQQAKPAALVHPLPRLPIVALAAVQERDWAANEKQREAFKAEVNEARSDVTSSSAKIEAYIRKYGKNASADLLEKMKKYLLQQPGNELETYENLCLDVCASGKNPDKALVHTACYLLAWQYHSQLKKEDGSIDMRVMIQRLYNRFEREDSFVYEFSKGRCETLATYIFNLMIESLSSEEVAAISVADKNSFLASFLYRRKSESELRDSIIAQLGTGIPEVNSDQAERYLMVVATQVPIAGIEIIKNSLTKDEERALAFARKKAFLARIETACSDRELKELEAFEGQYCAKGKGRTEMEEIEVMRKQVMQRKAYAAKWLTSSTEKGAALINGLEPAYRSKYQPSIFTPVAKFFHNRYVHYTGFVILGALAGAYGYWMYRKTVPAKLPRFM